ncbi:APC family permease [Candidatus Parcubacteria bacterium]|nr:APC family permease [Candidatus Parcubacteria bacterium]
MTKKKQKIILVFLSVVIAALVCSNFVSAQELTYPEIGGEAPTADTTLPEYIKYIFNFSMLLGAILAFAVLLFGGIRWLLSAGSPTATSDAKSWMLGGIIGLVLLLSSWLILTTINPELAILKLEDLKPFEPDEPPEYGPPEIKTTYYQEIPIGLLAEIILTKNLSCFDEDRNLIDCRTGEIIQNTMDDEFARDTDFRYCYDYDEEGNKIALLEDHDRLDCIKKLLGAINIKSEELRVKSEELKIIAEELKNESEELRDYAAECACNECDSSCSCANQQCDCTGDTCPHREEMETLRNDTMPATIEEMEEKREEIIILIEDGDPDNSKFLTVNEALERLKKLRDEELIPDLDYLKDAEELVKFPYGQRNNLAKYEYKKLNVPLGREIDKVLFENFDISEYCRVFNCITFDEDNPELCLKYGLNEEGKLCNVYNLDGEPASFYFPAEEYEK